MQGASSGLPVHFVDLPAELEGWPIPQMLVQTFVENEYKYAVSMDDVLTLIIHVSRETFKGEEMLLIRIEDDGKGYPEDVLSYMNGDAPRPLNDGERVGLWSVKRMMALMYDRDDLIALRNVEPHGCENLLRVPERPVHEYGSSRSTTSDLRRSALKHRGGGAPMRLLIVDDERRPVWPSAAPSTGKASAWTRWTRLKTPRRRAAAHAPDTDIVSAISICRRVRLDLLSWARAQGVRWVSVFNLPERFDYAKERHQLDAAEYLLKPFNRGSWPFPAKEVARSAKGNAAGSRRYGASARKTPGRKIAVRADSASGVTLRNREQNRREIEARGLAATPTRATG
jgi:hypothetical protein